MKNILYISALASENRIKEVQVRTKSNPGFAVQKFSRLLVKGLMENGAKVCVLSSPPILDKKKTFINFEKEVELGIVYKYIPYLNFLLLKHVCLFLYTFFYILFWGFKNRKDKVIICDVLAVSICMGALFASKINRIMSVAVVTDIYGLMQNVNKKSFIVRIAGMLNKLYSSSFNKYILLTEQMNNVVNPKSCPHIVMEALCDSSLAKQTFIEVEKSYPRTIIYAGGISEVYGLKMLAEGFIKANIQDAKLVYYGSGSYVNDFKELCEVHPNLEYGGIVPTDIVVKEEQKASLLVNPRFTKGEFTKYSFPSKNMEYMASGTPLLSTKLPGMPNEYHRYVYFFDKETVDGYADTLCKILSKTDEELKSFGIKAKNFVLKNKNNIAQGKRIIDFLNA